MERNWDWWQSDAARDARVSKYVAVILFSNPDNRRQEFDQGAPVWPAVFHYDPVTDTPFWTECKSPLHAQDFIKGADGCHFNEALRKLAA